MTCHCLWCPESFPYLNSVVRLVKKTSLVDPETCSCECYFCRTTGFASVQ